VPIPFPLLFSSDTEKEDFPSRAGLGLLEECAYFFRMRNPRNPILVIGGGAAGIIAAWKAAISEAPVILLERNRTLGIKLLISGGGKCNITHAGTMEEIRSAFLQKEARFLKPAFYRFGNREILDLLRSAGVPTAPRADGRVFPEHGTARHVVAALEQLCRDSGVQVRTGACVERIAVENGSLSAVVAGEPPMQAGAIALATGGASYPKTGTTGDGIRWAAELGHTIVPVRPALAPMNIEPMPPRRWQGIALRAGRLSALTDGHTLASWEGDVLFTHEGISGPAALELSRAAALAAERTTVTLEFDFFPGQDFSELDSALTDMIRHQGAKLMSNLIEAWLPNRLVPDLLQSAGIDPETRGHTLSRELRRSLTRLLKSWPIGRVVHIPLERGEVTAGGVALSEVDPHTMGSRKVPGLFLCGEILDIAGPVGGYNLQAAFSTGFVAGEASAAYLHRESSARDEC
jgi:predicted Rossmann fold flavoprotein